MTDEELKEKVIRHDIEFKTLTESLNALSENMKELTNSLKHIAVINEKLFNMDKDLKESFQRVHKRQDDIESDFKKGLKELEVFSFIARYPKIAGLTVIGMYVMTFENVRKLVFGG